MATRLFVNDGSSLLASSILAADSSLTVTATEGSLFPSPSGGDYAILTIEDDLGNIEIVKLTSRAGDVLSITRAQESTVALDFASGSRVEVRITKGSLDDFLQKSADQTITGDLILSGALTVTGIPLLSASQPQIRFFETDATSGEGAWRLRMNGSILHFEVGDDSFSTLADFMKINRSAATVQAITFGNTTDNPTFNLDVGRIVKNPTGTETAPDFTWAGESTTGIWRSGSGLIDFSFLGQNQIRFSSGINPIRIAGTDSDNATRYALYTPDQATQRGYFGYPTTGNDDLIIRNVVGTSMKLRVASNANRLTLDDTTGVTYLAVDGLTGEVGFRKVIRQTVGGTLTAAMANTCQAVSSTVTIDNSVHSSGDCISIYNNSASAISINKGTLSTLRLAGTTSEGNRTLAPRGLCTLWFNTSSEAIAMGPGVS